MGFKRAWGQIPPGRDSKERRLRSRRRTELASEKLSVLANLIMKYRHLGKSGLQLSELSFGAWVTFAQQISDKTAAELMTIAYDSGANFFDNAEAYAEGRAEIVMGNILKKKGWPR